MPQQSMLLTVKRMSIGTGASRDVFSEDELAQLRGFPEPARAELIRYFTLAPADEAFVRKFRGQAT